MPQPQRSVEEIVEAFRQTFSVPTSHDNWTPDTYPHQLGVINWLTTTLTAERERSAAMVAELLALAPGFQNTITGEVIYDVGVQEYMARITATAEKHGINPPQV
jgi:hypothetical protein